MHTRIVAIDPGKCTGIAVMMIMEGKVTTHETHRWERLNELIPDEDTLVLCEKPFMSRSVDPVVFEVFGAVQYQCHLVGATISFQGGEAPHFVWKRYKTQLNKKSISTSFSQHKKDAIAHLLYYWVHKQMLPLQDFLDMVKDK